MVTSCYGLSYLCQGFMFYDNSERVFSVSDGQLTVHNWRVLRECGEYCQQ